VAEGAWLREIQTFGIVDLVDDTPATVSVKRGVDSFRLAQRHLDEIWKLVLPPRTLLELKKLAQVPESSFRMSDDVWARIVYDFALAYHQRTLHREHVLSAFAPLFAGWVSSFAFEVPDAPLADSEGRLDRMCLQFESEKPYLIARWRWPVGFSP
jgi:glucosylglycerate synthase